MYRKAFVTILWSLVLTTALHAQVRHIFYDDGNPQYVDTGPNAFVTVRFTPSRPFTVHAVSFMVINTYGAPDGCQVWVEDVSSGGPVRVGYVPGPLPDRQWIRLELAGPWRVGLDDFHVILQQPGGPVSGPGWWVALDDGTTTQRTRMCYDGQTWVDYTAGDALIRVEGRMDDLTGV